MALCMEPSVGLGLTILSPLTEPPGAPNCVLNDVIICESQNVRMGEGKEERSEKKFRGH